MSGPQRKISMLRFVKLNSNALSSSPSKSLSLFVKMPCQEITTTFDRKITLSTENTYIKSFFPLVPKMIAWLLDESPEFPCKVNEMRKWLDCSIQWIKHRKQRLFSSKRSRQSSNLSQNQSPVAQQDCLSMPEKSTSVRALMRHRIHGSKNTCAPENQLG